MLTPEAKGYLAAGASPEVQVFNAIPADGIPLKELQARFSRSRNWEITLSSLLLLWLLSSCLNIKDLATLSPVIWLLPNMEHSWSLERRHHSHCTLQLAVSIRRAGLHAQVVRALICFCQAQMGEVGKNGHSAAMANKWIKVVKNGSIPLAMRAVSSWS